MESDDEDQSPYQERNMRVAAHLILITEGRRDEFLSLLKEHGITSKPKLVIENDFRWIEFALRRKMRLDEVTTFVTECERLMDRPLECDYSDRDESSNEDEVE